MHASQAPENDGGRASSNTRTAGTVLGFDFGVDYLFIT